MSEDFINLEKKPGGKKDIALSILIIVLVFVFVFGFVTLREYSARDLLSTASEKIVEEAEDLFSVREVDEKENDEELEEEVIIEEVYTETYVEKAEKGDGLTHLSRKAITTYMNEEGLELSDEERVYMEDYVQKRIAPEKTGPRYLEVGEEVEISREIIEDALLEVENLTPNQLDNLTHYASLVSY